MRERLRAFLNRPIETDAERRGAMIVAVAIVVGAAVVFLVLFGGPGSPSDDQPNATTKHPAKGQQQERGRADTNGSSQAGQPVTPAVPLPAELPARPPKVTRSAKAAAERAGRKFAADYLRFQRRKLRPEEITAATRELRRQIAREPRGRVSPAAAEHPPKVVGLDGQVVDRDTIVVTATVSRLGARFPLRMTASRGPSGWSISALQTEAG